MLTEKDYCDYETRNELIKLGYPAHLYDNTEVDKILGAILLYDAQKWLREEKDVIIALCPYTYNIVDKTHTWTFEIWFGDNLEIEIHDFQSYEEALLEGIKEAVKILTNKENE